MPACPDSEHRLVDPTHVSEMVVPLLHDPLLRRSRWVRRPQLARDVPGMREDRSGSAGRRGRERSERPQAPLDGGRKVLTDQWAAVGQVLDAWRVACGVAALRWLLSGYLVASAGLPVVLVRQGCNIRPRPAYLRLAATRGGCCGPEGSALRPWVKTGRGTRGIALTSTGHLRAEAGGAGAEPLREPSPMAVAVVKTWCQN